MTTYEVGTTAKFRGHYRERRQDGEWYDDIGCHMSAFGDDTARDLYTDITPPGPPLPAGTVLDPGKRYVYGSPSRGSVITRVNDVWDWQDERGIGHQYSLFVVGGDETVREIREPGSAKQESRPEWDAVKIDVTRVADREPRYIYVSTEDIATTEAEADEARAECTRLNDLLTGSTADHALLDGALMSTQMALTTAERIRGQHFESWMRTVKERDEHVARTAESEHVREAQQSQIRALEAKVAAREMALKAAQAEISRGLQKTRTDKAEAAGYLYTGRFLSKDNIWYARYDRPAPPVDETAAGYFTD